MTADRETVVRLACRWADLFFARLDPRWQETVLLARAQILDGQRRINLQSALLRCDPTIVKSERYI